MAEAAAPPKVRPSLLWLLVVAVLWITAVVVCIVVAIRPLVDLVTADTTGFRNGAQVAISTDGLTVYSTNDTVVPCVLTGADGSTIRMDDFGNDSFELPREDGTELHALASTPDGLPAGTYAITCDRASGMLAYGERVDFSELGIKMLLGFGIPAVLGLIGLILLIVVLVRRHRSKNRIRDAQAVYASPYPGAGWPPPGQGGYPQQGYPPQGYPQQSYPPQDYPQQGYPPQDYPPAQAPGYPPQPPPEPPTDDSTSADTTPPDAPPEWPPPSDPDRRD